MLARQARSEPVLALHRRQWLLRSGECWVLVLFVSFVLMYLSKALIIKRVTRLLDRSRFIILMGFILSLFLWV